MARAEVWRSAKIGNDFNSLFPLYEVSDRGRVRLAGEQAQRQQQQGRVNESVNASGYNVVSLLTRQKLSKWELLYRSPFEGRSRELVLPSPSTGLEFSWGTTISIVRPIRVDYLVAWSFGLRPSNEEHALRHVNGNNSDDSLVNLHWVPKPRVPRPIDLRLPLGNPMYYLTQHFELLNPITGIKRDVWGYAGVGRFVHSLDPAAGRISSRLLKSASVQRGQPILNIGDTDWTLTRVVAEVPNLDSSERWKKFLTRSTTTGVEYWISNRGRVKMVKSRVGGDEVLIPVDRLSNSIEIKANRAESAEIRSNWMAPRQIFVPPLASVSIRFLDEETALSNNQKLKLKVDELVMGAFGLPRLHPRITRSLYQQSQSQGGLLFVLQKIEADGDNSIENLRFSGPQSWRTHFQSIASNGEVSFRDFRRWNQWLQMKHILGKTVT